MNWHLFTFIAFMLSNRLLAGPLEDKGWLAWGDQRGYVEPCGCDPKADLGGIQRQSVFIKKERAVSPGLLLFNLGNNLPAKPGTESHKVPVILSALKKFAPEAALFNQLEAQTYKLHSDEFKGIPFVAANLKDAKRYPVVQSSVTVNGLYITGFVSPNTQDFFTPLNDSLLDRWRKLSKPSQQSVLLFAGNEADLRRLEASKLFDLIISANARPLDAVVGPEEKDNPRLLDRLAGKIRMVPVGGQGALRGGRLLGAKAQSLQELLGEGDCKNETPSLWSTCKPPAPSTPKLQAAESVTWLTQEYAQPSDVDKLLDQYQNASSQVYAANAKSRAKFLNNTPFAGSDACKTCHAAEYKIWQSSGHAHALATLTKVGKNKDPECVACHVLGYKEKGGFVSQKLSPQFANVTCENCHGPRLAHVSNPAVKHPQRSKAHEVCTSCHHGTHTSDFVFEDFWDKIKHGSKDD